MRFMMVSLVVAASVAAVQPQYRTHNDRLAAPHFSSPEAWAARAQYLREHVLASAGLLPMPERTPLKPVILPGGPSRLHRVKGLFREPAGLLRHR